MRQLIVFTDLDGTLLNHHDYSWKEAIPAIEQLKYHGFPLIINSSKTFKEIEYLSSKINTYSPVISENGAVVSLNIDFDTYLESNINIYNHHYSGKSYEEILNIIHKIRTEVNLNFTGFNDMSISEIMKVTGLDYSSAKKAGERNATEPIIWSDSQINLDTFIEKLNANDLTITKGGRFYHVMSPVNKGQAMLWLLECYKKKYPEIEWFSMALGDGINDAQMLDNADYPVLVKNDQASQPDVSHNKDIIVSEFSGAKGWNVSVQDRIDKFVRGN